MTVAAAFTYGASETISAAALRSPLGQPLWRWKGCGLRPGFFPFKHLCLLAARSEAVSFPFVTVKIALHSRDLMPFFGFCNRFSKAHPCVWLKERMKERRKMKILSQLCESFSFAHVLPKPNFKLFWWCSVLCDRNVIKKELLLLLCGGDLYCKWPVRVR